MLLTTSTYDKSVDKSLSVSAGEYCDMSKRGIIDPTKAVRTEIYCLLRFRFQNQESAKKSFLSIAYLKSCKILNSLLSIIEVLSDTIAF